MKRIFVEGLELVGRHGVYEEERIEGRTFVVDASVTLSDKWTTSEDDLVSTVDYRKIASAIVAHMGGESVQLVETLADRIVEDLFKISGSISEVSLTIRKKATGVPGEPTFVGVQINDTRDKYKGLESRKLRNSWRGQM